jgi:disease resistance protein RPM1
VNNIVIGGNIQVAKEIGDLEGLLGIVVHLDSGSAIHKEVRKHLAASLCRTNALRWLNVGDISGDDVRYHLDYLMDLPSPPQLLRYLRFGGGFSRLPDWVGSLSYLVEFCMSYGRLEGDQPFVVLCKAPNLRIIRLQRCFYRGDKLVARTAHNFPALKEMRVSCHNEFPSVISFQEGSMTKLETLELNFYDNQKSIEGVEHLKKLKEVQLIGWKNNSAINRALELLKEDSDRRSKDKNQYVVGVKYYD